MAQHDYNLANQSRTSYRSDHNNLNTAILTQNSGATAPTTTAAYMLWADTTTATLKRRNAADSGWIVRDTLDESFVLARSSNTILDISDCRKAIIATSTFTQTIDAAATIGDGWFIHYRNDGTGIITIDPNASELIDGATTLKLFPGDSCTIVCNGTAFKTIGLKQLSLIKTSTASASSEITFTDLDSTFFEYIVDIRAVIPATDAQNLDLQLSTNNGSTYESGASYYGWGSMVVTYGGGVTASTDAADSVIELANSMGTDPGEYGDFIVRIMNPSVALKTHVLFEGLYRNATPAQVHIKGSGFTDGGAVAHNAARFFFSSGNIESGTFKLYGLRA